MKRIEASSIDIRLFLEAIDRWMSVEACNCNREDYLDYDREYE
jgi:hypothetical protein